MWVGAYSRATPAGSRHPRQGIGQPPSRVSQRAPGNWPLPALTCKIHRRAKAHPLGPACRKVPLAFKREPTPLALTCHFDKQRRHSTRQTPRRTASPSAPQHSAHCTQAPLQLLHSAPAPAAVSRGLKRGRHRHSASHPFCSTCRGSRTGRARPRSVAEPGGCRPLGRPPQFRVFKAPIAVCRRGPLPQRARRGEFPFGILAKGEGPLPRPGS